ncbi:hypothetical protein KJ830_02230 [bacterium]|nr:hypothetical protein [bacterium]MBU4509845.1 hypothetical protein [bacterium]
MNILNIFFKTKEEKKYNVILKETFIPIIEKINSFEEEELKSFKKTASWLLKGRDDVGEFEKMIKDKWGLLKIIFNASEHSLRRVLFYSPEELSFRKHLSSKEIDIWIYKVSLALISYSSIPGSVKDTPKNDIINNLYRDTWSKYIKEVLKAYNKIYKKNILICNLEHYVSGLKEDLQQGYSTSMNLNKVNEMMFRDFVIIGRELIEEIWREKVNENELQENIPYIKDLNSLSPSVRKIYFLGTRIWQVHKQRVQPFIENLDKDVEYGFSR